MIISRLVQNRKIDDVDQAGITYDGLDLIGFSAAGHDLA
jgi:hypothetical protein